MASELELMAMRRAIVLSALGLGTTSPNPPVGCVILGVDGTTVGAGFHQRKGGPHAEVHALTAAGEVARGGTAVVTLEPCNHVGVTPACRQQLLDAGIARVVIGVIDPTSRGDGGAAVLAAAGVEVEIGVLHDEVLAVLGPWLTATVRRRPYVTWVHTRRVVDEQLVATLRGGVDVVVAGGTVSEGLPGGHSSAHFQVPEAAGLGSGIAHWLADAYASGIRRVLMVNDDADTLRSGLDHVDELIVELDRSDPTEATAAVGSALLADGFALTEVAAHDRTLTVYLRRTSLL
ncbi:bifunctional diaminohydroxyphosphoribosylaminopyrimidine deaminase/5-amino-6-(5-phosphoribosylamino)uracil reductase RibD [Dactylosporangium sp. NPDC049742]|uniref:bifunctional diaminohydroxyphosphoribosylaminopyrimidine deaminase/5-amino-6-(5-phosphoribosylamino)uracil reductase RibD n=1 Tax=Dactylosporangium sp. NPDC049742 TaxID=3154737 RepID=UPI00344A8424